MATAIEKTSLEFSKAYQTAEDVLADCIENHRTPTYEESQFMESRLGWDKEQQRRQLSRIETVLRLQAEAGSQQQRNSAAQLLDEAKATAAEQEPELNRQIDELTAKRNQLHNETRRLQKLVDGSTSALDRLKDLAPPHIVDKANSLHVNANETIGREYHELAGQIRHMEVLTKPDQHADVQAYMQTVARYDSRFVLFDVHQDSNAHVRPEHRGGGWRVNHRFSKEWEEHKQSLIDELPGLREQLSELKQQYDAAKLAATKPLELYWR